MAKIKNANPKSSSGSYERIFNNKKLGDLITKIQSTSISNGSELEKIIKDYCYKKQYIVGDFDLFLEEYDNKQNSNNIIKILPKNVIKKSKLLKNSKNIVNFEPDFVILKIDINKKHCYIIELKDGFEFDTKKVIGEKEHLEKFANFISRKIPYSCYIKFCCFNELDKNIIKKGLKNAFELDEIMTGQEFCELINIDYNEILNFRKNDAKENLEYFVEQILLIEDVKKIILEKI